ncbi:MAG: Gfo/Idh/MocA family oxidoreductase [Planctomycetaceae bacterium]|nr:Gfo/Idh/MocA family oxidoreductase [Planctomycetaceae bacterium]
MLRIAIIGTGGMAHTHAAAFKAIEGVAVTACCDVDRPRAEAFAARHDIAAVYSDHREMLDRETLDGVSNVTPDSQHAAVSLAVIERGVNILCEKPLATSLEDARRMTLAAAARGVVNMVNFSYRNSCGLQAAAAAVKSGVIGSLRHIESSYLQSWLAQSAWGDWRVSPGLTWRLSSAHGSAGVLGDLGCHIYDLTSLLAGQDIVEIFCRLATFDKGVEGNRLGEYVLDANDSFVANIALAGGAVGTVHSSRWACGHHNSLRCRLYGDAGAIEVDLDGGYDHYRICRGKTALESATWDVVSCDPTPSNYQRFIQSIRTGVNDPSDFANGARVQACLHWSMESDRLGRPVKIVGGS